MVKKLVRKIKLKKLIDDNKKASEEKGASNNDNCSISEDIEENLKTIQKIFETSSDVNIRSFCIGLNKKKAFIVSIEGLYDKKVNSEIILEPLMKSFCETSNQKEISMEYISDYVISSNSATILESMEDAVNSVLDGNTLLFLDGEKNALEIDARSWRHRNIEKPETENLVRGPHESFIETLSVNISLLRRKIKSADFKIESLKIGRRTRTDAAIVYLKSIADIKIVAEVKRRLNSIEIDSILESGYIEEFIEDSPLSPFPTIGNVETPDKLAAKILEGRVGIMIDGTPIVLTVPYLFIESFQVSEDYYLGAMISTQLRLLRLLSFFVSLLFPALYVSLQGFHPNIIPRQLLFTIQVTREGVPLPTFVEAAGMILVWEVLREAGVRMPRSGGQALSIVGALIIGQVAVNAGLISPLMIVVVASTGIMSLINAPIADTVSLLRIPILIMSSILGLFGVIWCFIFMCIHLASIRSFGVPYMYPYMPFNLGDMKDSIVRVYWWLMKTRPGIINEKDIRRAGNTSMPSPKK